MCSDRWRWLLERTTSTVRLVQQLLLLCAPAACGGLLLLPAGDSKVTLRPPSLHIQQHVKGLPQSSTRNAGLSVDQFCGVFCPLACLVLLGWLPPLSMSCCCFLQVPARSDCPLYFIPKLQHAGNDDHTVWKTIAKQCQQATFDGYCIAVLVRLSIARAQQTQCVSCQHSIAPTRPTANTLMHEQGQYVTRGLPTPCKQNKPCCAGRDNRNAHTGGGAHTNMTVVKAPRYTIAHKCAPHNIPAMRGLLFCVAATTVALAAGCATSGRKATTNTPSHKWQRGTAASCPAAWAVGRLLHHHQHGRLTGGSLPAGLRSGTSQQPLSC